MESNLAIWISPMTGEALIGKLNKKKTERLSYEVMDEDTTRNFVFDYLFAELEKAEWTKSELVYSQQWDPKLKIVVKYI